MNGNHEVCVACDDFVGGGRLVVVCVACILIFRETEMETETEGRPLPCLLPTVVSPLPFPSESTFSYHGPFPSTGWQSA